MLSRLTLPCHIPDVRGSVNGTDAGYNDSSCSSFSAVTPVNGNCWNGSLKLADAPAWLLVGRQTIFKTFSLPTRLQIFYNRFARPYKFLLHRFLTIVLVNLALL